MLTCSAAKNFKPCYLSPQGQKSPCGLKNYNDGFAKLEEMRTTKNSNKSFEFDILMANPPFAGDIEDETMIVTHEQVGKKEDGKYQKKVGRDILFIERNINFLKKGGRMAVVLPQGRFNNSSDKYLREYIAQECRILAVIGLHGNVFKPHTGTKTSVIFLQKWNDDKNTQNYCPKIEDYPIFFATMQEQSKDNSGEKIYRKNAQGTKLKDLHGHDIVQHDLFSQAITNDTSTPEGIAEAFIEFAKKEKLSFFDTTPQGLQALAGFNSEKYKSLLEGLEISEIWFSELSKIIDYRIESEYFDKKFLKIDVILSKIKTISFTEIVNFENGRPYNADCFNEFEGIRVSKIGDVTNKRSPNTWSFITNDEFYEQKGKYLKINDILMTLTGDPPDVGKVNIISNNEHKMTWNQRVAKISIKKNAPIITENSTDFSKL